MNLKKCYHNLELPYDSTIEDVMAREKAKIKILQNKAEEKGISVDKDIVTIENCAKIIIENIKNGVKIEKHHNFECSWQSVCILLAVLGFVGIICFFSFYVLL